MRLQIVVVVLIISEKSAKASRSEEPSFLTSDHPKSLRALLIPLPHRLSLMELLMLYHVFLREVHMRRKIFEPRILKSFIGCSPR